MSPPIHQIEPSEEDEGFFSSGASSAAAGLMIGFIMDQPSAAPPSAQPTSSSQHKVVVVLCAECVKRQPSELLLVQDPHAEPRTSTVHIFVQTNGSSRIPLNFSQLDFESQNQNPLGCDGIGRFHLDSLFHLRCFSPRIPSLPSGV